MNSRHLEEPRHVITLSVCKNKARVFFNIGQASDQAQFEGSKLEPEVIQLQQIANQGTESNDFQALRWRYTRETCYS